MKGGPRVEVAVVALPAAAVLRLTHAGNSLIGFTSLRATVLKWPKGWMRLVPTRVKLMRPAKCIHLGAMVAKAPGCHSGMRCTYQCDRGHPNTVPAKECQTCGDYAN